MIESTKKVIIKILNNPKKLKRDELKIIKNISENYPFFKPARILHLLFSKKFKTIDYNNLLRSSSVTSTDRSHLYYVLNNDILNQEEKIDLINELDKESFKQEISFLDWISKTKPTPIKSNFKNDNSFKLNDLKIKKHNHKIKIKRKDYMTETLAKLYIKQEKFEDALKAYKILCLKYPEKISLFADQIKIIKNHIKNK